MGWSFGRLDDGYGTVVMFGEGGTRSVAISSRCWRSFVEADKTRNVTIGGYRFQEIGLPMWCNKGRPGGSPMRGELGGEDVEI